MSSPDLSFFSYEILGLVGATGAAPHDLRGMVQRGRILDWAGESQYYAEPKRLARLGYLDARKEPGKTRERTVYTLTDKGLDALRKYAQTPVRFVPVKSDLLLRLLIADLVGEAATRDSIAPLRDELEEIEACLDQAEASAHTLPHREKYLLLIIDYLRRRLALEAAFVDEAERALGGSAGGRGSEETASAQA
jgi:DNA-binding PadR family transcriptional regulator